MNDKTEKKARVISFVNMKGGVGKTSLTINFANELVKEDHNVLVVDMDPQFNATQSLLLHKNMMNNTQKDLKMGKEEFEQFEFEQEVSSSEKYKALSREKGTVLQLFGGTDISEKSHNPSLIHTIKEGLDLIPGDLAVAKEISGDTAGKLGCLLDHFRKYNLLEKYNYILIDCPPTRSILTHASLFVSDYYIIPSKVDLYSSIGIELLEEQIDEKMRKNSTYTDSIYKREHENEGTTIERLGVIFTLVNDLQTQKSRQKRLKKDFPNINFFNAELSYIPSVPTKVVMYSDVKGNLNYSQLDNSITKITREIIDMIESREQ